MNEWMVWDNSWIKYDYCMFVRCLAHIVLHSITLRQVKDHTLGNREYRSCWPVVVYRSFRLFAIKHTVYVVIHSTHENFLSSKIKFQHWDYVISSSKSDIHEILFHPLRKKYNNRNKRHEKMKCNSVRIKYV